MLNKQQFNKPFLNSFSVDQFEDVLVPLDWLFKFIDLYHSLFEFQSHSVILLDQSDFLC